MDNNGKTSPFASLTSGWVWPVICLLVLPGMEAAIWQLISGLSHLFLVGTLGLGVAAILVAFLAACFNKKLLKAASIICVCLYLGFIGYAVLFHYQETAISPSVTRSAAIVGSGRFFGSITILKPAVPILMYVTIAAIAAVIAGLLYLLWRVWCDDSTWQPLTRTQNRRLRDVLLSVGRQTILIEHNPARDCVLKAHELGRLFKDCGWPVVRQPYPSSKPYNGLYFETVAVASDPVSRLILMLADMGILASATNNQPIQAEVLLFVGPKRPRVELV